MSPLPPRRLHYALILLAAGSLALAGCQDATIPTPTDVGPARASVEPATEPARELARSLALALRKPGVRNGLLTAMQASPFHEGKVFFSRAHFTGSLAGLLGHMAEAAGVTRRHVIALIDELPPLELYLPVPEHRREWDGSEHLLVATVLEEGATPYGVRPDGQEVTLSAEAPPSTPTLVLVPAESFTARGEPRSDLVTAAPVELRASVDCGPYALQDCGDGGGGGSTWSPPPGATWQRDIGIKERISHLRFWDDKEGWPNGLPEFYILVDGTLDTDNFGELHKKIVLTDDIWDDYTTGDWALWDQLTFVTWDTDYGTRVRIQCWESDGTPDISVTLSGNTDIQGFANVDFSYTFTGNDGREGGDDACGTAYVTPRLSNGAWTLIPDGNDDGDPEYDGTSILQWYGYGIDTTG